MERPIDNPIPRPSRLVVKKGSKSFSRSSAAAQTLGNGKLVGARHIEELARAARREGIRAEHEHGLIANAPVQLRLVTP